MLLHFRILLFSILLCIFSCKKREKTAENYEAVEFVEQHIEFAEGFSITNHKTYKEVNVKTPWPEASDTLRYILYPKGTTRPTIQGTAKFIQIPIKNLVVTSTTDIPMLEYLELENKLVGFPNTDFISSERTRKLIDSGKVRELGNENAINTETVLEVDPELIIGFSADGNTKSYDILEKSGIPVVINGSWLESHPLGRAEWIKFIAAFFNKEVKAKNVFEKIQTAYTKATELAKKTEIKPTVLSGSMYKDVWYVPGGDSYIATFFKEANTEYIWSDTNKTGSIALSFESVLEKAQEAHLWIGSETEKTLKELGKSNNRYRLFDAFKNKTVYSSSLVRGEKGGIVFYELGPMRPDLIVKDIIKIAHPEILKDYELYFFEKLK